MNLFAIQDKTNRIIYITKERWRHILHDHPEMSDKIEYVMETLTKPLIITESENNQNVKYYYRHYKNINLKEKYLIVITKYLNGKGFIITSFYVNRIVGIK